MQQLDEAISRILSDVPLMRTESLHVLQARGRVLSEDILAPSDLPAFSNSAMDGYAIRVADVAEASDRAPVSLRVTQTIPASGWSDQTLGPGEAARIFTGAPIPPGADAVELQENVTREGDLVTLTRAVPLHKSIRHQGDYIKQGEPMLAAGTCLEPGEIGLLASIGRSMFEAYRRPRVAILSCGNELVTLDQTPAPGQLYESNRFALAALIEEAGGEPWMLPLVPDDMEQIKTQLAVGREADILISSGGVSVGEFDLVRPALEAEGFSLDFWKVAIKPGKPLVFGRRDQCLFFGLPGNPGSSMVTFSLFVLPALRKMMGHKRLFHTKCKATLARAARATAGRIHLVRGRVTSLAGQSMLSFAPYHRQGSGNLLSMQNVNALAVLPPDSGVYEAGEVVDVILLRTPWDDMPDTLPND